MPSIREAVKSASAIFPEFSRAADLHSGPPAVILSAMKKIFSTLGFLVAAILAAGAAEFTVIATSDLHARIDAMRRIAPAIAAERQRAGADRTLLVDVGDSLQGSVEGAFRSGELPMRLLNLMRYDFWTPGNHDFDFRQFRFHDFSGVVLGANWSVPGFQPAPWRPVELDGVKIAVIGLTEERLSDRLPPETPVRLIGQREALDAVMPEIRRARPDFILLLRHDGLYGRGGNLYDLIAAYPEIDLVIGGHTHVEVVGERVGRSFFVQPGKHGECFAAIRVEMTAGRKPRITARLVRPAPDADAAPLPPDIAAVEAAARADADATIGVLTERWSEPKTRIFTSTPLGAAIARTMLEAAQARVAIFSRRTGDDLLTGTVTRRRLFDFFPFEDRIEAIDLTPEELRAVIEAEVELLRKGQRAALFAGVEMTLDKKGKISKLTLPAPDESGRICTAVTDYALGGGGGLTLPLRRAAEAGAPCRPTGMLLRDAMAAAIPRR